VLPIFLPGPAFHGYPIPYTLRACISVYFPLLSGRFFGHTGVCWRAYLCGVDVVRLRGDANSWMTFFCVCRVCGYFLRAAFTCPWFLVGAAYARFPWSLHSLVAALRRGCWRGSRIACFPYGWFYAADGICHGSGSRTLMVSLLRTCSCRASAFSARQRLSRSALRCIRLFCCCVAICLVPFFCHPPCGWIGLCGILLVVWLTF